MTTTNTETSPVSRLLKVDQAAQLLGVSSAFLNKLRIVGEGPPFLRLGRRAIRYVEVDLLEWARTRLYENTSQYPDK